MTLPENISFGELILKEHAAPGQFNTVLDAMEAVEIIELASQLGDRVLILMRAGVFPPEQGAALLGELLDAVRNPIEAAARVAEIRRELKEHGK